MNQRSEDNRPQVNTLENHWSVDKKVPLALIMSLVITVIVQTGFAVWWVSAISSRVDQQSQRITQLESVRASERITALEALMPRIESQLNRIEDKIDSIRGQK